jgi:hypothetical protein
MLIDCCVQPSVKVNDYKIHAMGCVRRLSGRLALFSIRKQKTPDPTRSQHRSLSDTVIRGDREH